MKSQSFETLSVVVPVYNSGKTCIRAIESILKQTRAVSEIIIVDDGSTDDSAEVLRNYFCDLLIPIYIYSIKNRGAAGARNFGIRKAHSKWIAFLDSDDAWFPKKIQLQMQAIQDYPSIGLIGSLTNMKAFSQFYLSSEIRMKHISLHKLLFKNYFQTSTVVVKREILCNVGCFPEGRTHAEEGDLFMKIAAAYKCFLMNEVLVDYADGKSGFGVAGLSSNLWLMERGEIANIFGVWQRKDANFLMVILALCFSLIKFIRRLLVYSYCQFSHGHR